jgi:hypothetical protein
MKKYWYLIVLPAALFLLGALMNQAVILANHGHMPVSWPGGCSMYPDQDPDVDPIHVCMTKDSHLRILADWLKDDSGIQSPGDWLMDIANAFFTPFLILWIILTTIDFIKHGKDDTSASP